MRYEAAFAPGERVAASHRLLQAGARVIAWAVAAGRSYALVSLDASAALPAPAQPGERWDEPALAVLHVESRLPERRAALREALQGAGRPLGIVDARADGNATIVELDTSRTPLALLVAIVDAELAGGQRTIRPLLPLDDATLAAFAGAVLCEPEIDRARLLETYLEPILDGVA